jgi:hypothetical protein
MKTVMTVAIALGVLSAPALARQPDECKTGGAQLDAALPQSQTKLDDASPFVVRDGAVYLRFEATPVDIPMTGGGASGCVSLDLERRARASRAYADELERREHR